MKSSTILVIEDQASVRGLLVQILEEAGYQVYQAADGRQGLERFQAQPVDLVLTDLEMPEMNGLDLILELTRSFLNVKVIAISGVLEREGRLNVAKLLGARQTFQKPLDMNQVLSAVRYELAH